MGRSIYDVRSRSTLRRATAPNDSQSPESSPSNPRLTPSPGLSEALELDSYSADHKNATVMNASKEKQRRVESPTRRSHEGLRDGQETADPTEKDDRVSQDQTAWTIGRQPFYSVEEAKAVRKKFDRRLVPFLTVLYLLSFLDRSNIGNARIIGLEQDLNLTSSQYEWLLTCFYVAYIISEPMALLYRVIPAHIYISICVCSWGIIASMQSICTSFVPLVILRTLLGVGEAAFGPGVPFYLSFFYLRDELALRVGLFISAAPIATAMASGLAWVITKLGQNGGIAPWRLLFLIEGFPSVLVAVAAWRFIPDSPGTATFLSKRQKRIAKLRLRESDESSRSIHQAETNGLKWREILRTIIDPKCYISAAMFFSCNVAFSSLPVFLPTIIQEMHHTPLFTQLLLLPPYLISAIFLLTTCFLSDRTSSRSIPLIIHALLASSGYTLLSLSPPHILNLSSTIRYMALIPTTIGFFSAITLIITWTINNQRSATGRGTAITIMNIIGQMGPLLGTRLYPRTDGPYYTTGMAICACFMLAVAFLAASLRVWLQRQNTRMQHDGRRGDFRYMI